jgi:hypothetical protein
MTNKQNLTPEEENERLKALVIFLRDELDELINSIDEEVLIEEE